MNIIRIASLILLVCCTSLHAASDAGFRRFALVIGANDGGPGRAQLRFSFSDAGSFSRVMKEIGGVGKDDALLLYQPSRELLLSAMTSLYSKVQTAGKVHRKTEFIFYYSGHSDENGILLGGEKVLYSELRRAIETIPADVRIAILDSCYSGAFTQMKGGVRKAPFIVDTAYDMKGNAFLSSSSRDEASQESEKIKGSFFTHYLVLGLRGAADITQDRRITLNEVYQYAYRETLVRTEKTLGGAQHPNYSIKMVGTGDVILTDLSARDSRLALDSSIEGRVAIYTDAMVPVAEFDKAYGREMELFLEEGHYTVMVIVGDIVAESTVSVNGSSTLTATNFTPITREITAMRGERKTPRTPPRKKDRNAIFDYSSLRQIEFAAYGSNEIRFSQIGDTPVVMGGGQLGMIFAERYFLGFAGYALLGPDSRRRFRDKNYVGEESNVSFAYGGILFRYFLLEQGLFNVSFGLLTGGGSLEFAGKSTNYEDDESANNFNDIFGVIEPEISVHVMLFKHVLVSASASQRLVYGIDSAKSEFSNSDFNRPSLGISAAFVWWF
jgi:hypothetical protein